MLCKMTARCDLVAPTDRHGRTRLNPLMLSLLAMLCKMTDRRKWLNSPTSNPCPLVAMLGKMTDRRKRLNSPTSNPCPSVAMLCKMTARCDLVAPTDRREPLKLVAMLCKMTDRRERLNLPRSKPFTLAS
jgi:hypothetical protein